MSTTYYSQVKKYFAPDAREVGEKLGRPPWEMKQQELVVHPITALALDEFNVEILRELSAAKLMTCSA